MNIEFFFVKNMLSISIFVFLIVFYAVHVCKPGCFYKKDGSIRLFGVGYKNKTIFPLWLFSIIVGILSYISIQYYISFRMYF